VLSCATAAKFTNCTIIRAIPEAIFHVFIEQSHGDAIANDDSTESVSLSKNTELLVGI
jgi:hypothetical protein